MFKTILVPLDGSELAEAVIPLVRDIAASTCAAIVLLRVPENVLYDPAVVAPPVSVTMYEHVRVEARDYLHRVEADLAAAGFKVRAKVNEGLVADAILECAESEHAELIAMSTHGRSGLARWLLGSIAEKIVRSSAIPVLLVRPHKNHQA